MGVGQVIGDTFGTIKERFGSLLGLWAIYFGIIIALFLVLGVGMGAIGLASFATLAEGDAFAAGAGIVVLAVLFYLGYLLVAMAQYASLILMASPLDRPTVGTALSAGWRAAPALLLLMVVLIIAYIPASLLLALAGTAFSALGDAGSIVFAILLLPLVIWVGCRLSLLFAVAAVDRVRNPFTVIGRSWRLTKGHALTIFLASLVFMVIVLLVCAVLLLPSIGLLRSMADPASLAAPDAAAPALGGLALLMVGGLVASALFNIGYCAFMAVLHSTLTEAQGEGAAQTFA